MSEIFSFANIGTLLVLILLQAVLGFDNLLYISIESKRVPEDKQSFVRRVGLALAIILRIVLLFAVLKAIVYFQKPFLSLRMTGIIEGEINVHAFIVLIGGGFIIYTALKEITHMLSVEDIENAGDEKKGSVARAMFWIVLMNWNEKSRT